MALRKKAYSAPRFLDALPTQGPARLVLTGRWLVEACCGPSDVLFFFLLLLPRCEDLGPDEAPRVSHC